jgi:serine/threonine protein kinase
MAGIDLSHLELQEVIGKGGQGIVYRGRIGDADVAIKVIAPATHTGAEQIAQRLGRFARAGGGSSVAAVLAHGILKDAPTQLSDQLRDMPREAIYLVMPYLPQGTLADLPRPVSERTAVA